MADTATPAKAKVLVADDSSLVRLYYRSALENAGFESVHRHVELKIFSEYLGQKPAS